MPLFLKIFLPCLLSFGIVVWIFPILLKISKEKNIVDSPNNRKLQTEPVPVLGGIVVFFGVLAAMLLATCLAPEADFLLPVMIAMGIMAYMGFMDDSVVLSARVRVLAEVLVILAMAVSSGFSLNDAHGLWGVGELQVWVALPLTLLAGVGIINAFNMIDGINGLASGLGILCCSVFGYWFLCAGDWADAILALSAAAALVPFLVHNVFGKTSKMYLGDTGSMSLGVMLTWFVIVSITSGSPLMQVAHSGQFNPIPMCLAVLSLPVFDTLRVAILRVCRGYSPFRPDKTHLHHVFIALGFSHSFTSLIEILMDGLVITIWALSYSAGLSPEWQVVIVVGVSLTLYVCQYFVLDHHLRRETATAVAIRSGSRKTHFGHSRWWLALQGWLDRNSENKNLSR